MSRAGLSRGGEGTTGNAEARAVPEVLKTPIFDPC